jgi:putative long chain acyl-CoA synthase
MGAENALEVIRLGRLGPRYGAPFDVVYSDRLYKLRHYGSGASADKRPVLVLVPPLMLTAEIYDVAEDISAVARLTEQGIDPWVVDFGAPETEEGGMSRTLDDHVRAVSDAIDRVQKATGRDVHLAGYSQGGMFAYQVAAYRRSAGIASVITFGSPVDIHQGLPNVSTDLAARIVRAARSVADVPLRHMEGLPGVLTSTGFKLFSFRKELQQIADFLKKLHDRQALEKRESRRRFLAGEGFVAWPGPAFRKFVDDFVVHNRLMSGGFVIDGRTVTLADIRSPVLAFVGGRDDIARPPMVRAVRRAAPNAELFEITVQAGHFGLVVGSTATRETWPGVIEWLKWREGLGPPPRLLAREEETREPLEVEDAAFEEPLDFELFYDTARRTLQSAWERVEHAFEDAGDSIDGLRYQLPRLTRLGRIDDDTRTSLGRALGKQAKKIPEQTFFLWKGRAFTYADADRRVNNVVRGLIASGVRAGAEVGVVMRGRPSYLSMVTALNRLGAVAVLVSPEAPDAGLREAAGTLAFVATDPESAGRVRRCCSGDVLVLGGGPERAVIDGVLDMEAIDPDAVELPSWYKPNSGRAGDLAIVFVSFPGPGQSRRARVTNRRWATSAYGAAAACTLSKQDTVYCALPLHHPAGLLVSVGGALVGGSRLALATRFEADVFWTEVRRYGASVAFYAGEMCRELTNAPSRSNERDSPLRLFAGSGIRADVWREVVRRFGTGVLEFYAATEVNLVLANAAGDKLGALGRPLPGSADMAIVRYDFDAEDLARDPAGRLVRAGENEPGMLLAEVDPKSAMHEGADSRHRIVRDAFQAGDAWFVTGDLLRRDADGDCWFVDRLRDVVRTARGPVPSRPIEDALYELPEVLLAAAYGAPLDGAREVPVASVVLRPGTALDVARLVAALGADARPRFIRLVDSLPLNDGYRPLKALLREAGIGSGPRALAYDEVGGTYRPMDAADYASAPAND